MAKKKTAYPASLLCDFYKISHREQYPDGTEFVYSNWTPRSTYIEGVKGVVAFGMQAFIIKFLIEYFDEHFFDREQEDVVGEYHRFIKYTLGVENPDTSHIAALHNLGYLPLHIKMVKEGTIVPLRVPMATVENTHPDFFWLTNYIETLMSSENWLPSTSATIALEFRKLLTKYALLSGGDLGFVPFQGHDFSQRGMVTEAAKLSGAGHLTSFVGTDTIPAIMLLEEFYNANIEKELVGTSVNATEHSVMCAGGKDSEFKTYDRLINKVHPKGILSIVSDTWDLWYVLNTIIAGLKESILKRDGKVVIRPDSGNPVKILCGDAESDNENERKGVIEILWDIFGGTINDKGFKELNPHIGAIYGDSITLARAEAICKGLMEKGFATTNVVFGIGSFTYQYQTRDTFGFAMKATQVEINGEEISIQKDPATDTNKTKKSLTGRIVVLDTEEFGIVTVDGLTIDQQREFESVDLLEDVFLDGELLRNQSLAEIRALITSQIS
jgi:nicotinamide phosphoribosyltransferase